jgi:ankyrin repeat protein
VNEEGQTPLHYAIETQQHEIALFLLKIGHEVNTADRSQWTPLISASKFGNLEVVRELLRRGAKQKSKDDDICEMVVNQILLHDNFHYSG